MTPTTDLVSIARRHSLGDILARTAARYPHRTALVWRNSRESYEGFNTTVNRIAHGLADRGVTKGDRIVLLSHNCREFVLTYFALAKLGALSVPVNFMLKPAEVAFILDHSGATGYIVEDGLGRVMSKAIELAEAGQGDTIRGWIELSGTQPEPGWENVLSWAEYPDGSEPEVAISDDDALQLMYTSGTESRPKGVTLSSRSLIAQYVSCIVDGNMEEDDVEIHSLPFYHCAQLHCFFTPDVYLGATNVILPRPDPDLIFDAIERERVTKLFCPPTVWISLLRSPAFDRHDLSSLRKGYYGASAMPVEVLKEWGNASPTFGFGTSMARPKWRRWRPSSNLTSR